MASSYDGLIISIAGLGTVLSAAWQYISRYEERAAQHRLAAAEYSSLRRELDRCAHYPPSPEQLTTIQAKADFLAKHTPLVEARIWKRTDEYVAKERAREEAMEQK